MADKAILFDSSLCIACRGCQSACKQWNGLGSEETRNSGTYENPPDLTSDTWVKIKFKELETSDSIDWIFTRQSCMHCTDAACVSVCSGKALKHHPDGFVIHSRDKCVGCAYCVEACPFDVPRMSGSSITGIRKMEKCTFCRDRVDNQYEPACVKTCPTGALLYGERDKLVSIGRDSTDQIRERYPDASLYGAGELGGLHAMYVIPHKPEVHGLPAAPKVSSTVGIHQFVRWAGVGAASVGFVLIGVNFIASRARNLRQLKNDSRDQELKRYRKRTVWFHWVYTVSFLALMLTGGIVGQDLIFRIIHRIAAAAFVAGPIIYFIINPRTALQFLKTSFTWNRYDLISLKALTKYYLGGSRNDVPPQGFADSGQKGWQLTVILAHVFFVMTGAGMWFRAAGDISSDQFGWLVIMHDFAFIASGSMLAIHAYLKIIHPQTRKSFGAMISGNISSEYAKEYHRQWYDEVTKSQDQ